jgi:hypothetical protein
MDDFKVTSGALAPSAKFINHFHTVLRHTGCLLAINTKFNNYEQHSRCKLLAAPDSAAAVKGMHNRTCNSDTG